jgi:hypothetical protein
MKKFKISHKIVAKVGFAECGGFADISMCSAMVGHGISMSYTNSESLLDDLSNKPAFVKIHQRIKVFWS